MPMTRREFCVAALNVAWGASVSACNDPSGSQGVLRLMSRPATPTGVVQPGLITLGDGGSRDGLLYVPASYDPALPAALVVGFHGAGGSADGPMNLLRPFADNTGFIVLTVDSRGRTWDAVGSTAGADVPVIERSLQWVFERCAIEPSRVFVSGFSDGASYALGIGLANGDLFSGIVAFSPGFIPPNERQGRPRVFISHGTEDTVLPIDATSRGIVAELRADGYEVLFREFAGGHGIPSDVAQEAIAWLEISPQAVTR